MLILLSNDDGYQAKGVRQLMGWLSRFGRVVAVCPDTGRSGQSMALTFNAPLRVEQTESPVEGCELWHCSGTPVDCIKIAQHTILNGEKPDLVVAGINHGSNSSVNVLYSGTMGAVFEGCSWNVPAVGFSLTDHHPDADFSACEGVVCRVVEEVLKNGLPDGICLNVNIPKSGKPGMPIRLTRACRGRWSEEFRRYTDPMGKPFYWLTGEFINEEPNATDTDEAALARGEASVVAETLDRTASASQTPAWLHQAF